MRTKISVRKGLLFSLPPHTKPYAFRQTLPSSWGAYVICGWPLREKEIKTIYLISILECPQALFLFSLDVLNVLYCHQPVPCVLVT